MAKYIEQEALLNKLCYQLKPIVDFGQLASHFYSMVEDEIKRIPAADVAEVRHGEWKPLLFSVHYCSECYEIYRRTTYKRKRLSNYCPNCGAKMDGKGGGK